MALTLEQLINLACIEAKGPAYNVLAGQYLNLILQELAQDYQIVGNEGWLTGQFTVTGPTPDVHSANVVKGSGPYALPSDFLRMDRGDFFWQLGGINYFPTPLDKPEFDNLVQQPGFASYPTAFCVDTSTTPYGLYIWPASSGAYQYFGRYRKSSTDYTNPETSSTVPWFPNQMYLKTRLAAEVMALTGDTRRDAFLKDATYILNQYMKLEGNNSDRAARVTLDRRHFGPRWSTLPSAKAVPW